jgi:RNA polymerase sigma factor for flagellar operon FliA
MQTTVSEDTIAEIWVRYKRCPCLQDRETLIVAHIPLVRYVASRMMPTLHSSVERQDLVSYGMFGLMDAIEKFDIHNGVKFATFATYRIRGAITDEMRAQAWEPRSVRARSRVVLQAMADLEQKLGRPPTEDEVAQRAQMSVPEMRRLASDQRLSRVTSINRGIQSDAGGMATQLTLEDTLVAVDGTAIGEDMTLLSGRLASAIPSLPEQERILLQMLYAHPTGDGQIGMSLKEIACVLGVTESWISLLHTRAMVMLQRTLSGQALA